MTKQEEMYIKAKCPDCAWSQFKEWEAVGMTPCWSCNSTGYFFEPLIKEKHEDKGRGSRGTIKENIQ